MSAATRRLGLPHRPVAHADAERGDDQERRAAHRDALGDVHRTARGLGRAALTGNEVDANHRSPARRSARTDGDGSNRGHFLCRNPEPAFVVRHLLERIEALDRAR
jgi:hypothetical protein